MTDGPVAIRRLPTGVEGLDAVLGGGLPELSFTLIAGGPGCGKTTLAHQLLFTNASPERPAIYFTVLGEPPLKMLRYQQQFAFFDPAKLGSSIRFVHLGQELVEGGLGLVLARIIREVEQASPALVVVDSFRSVVRVAPTEDGELELQRFVQELALRLASYEATSFLVGEYLEPEENSNPIFTVADGIIWLHQSAVRNSVVRRLQVMKMRGQQEIPGFHTLRIDRAGVRVFPRLPNPAEPRGGDVGTRSLKRTGVAGLDEMLGGGLPEGFSALVVGPSGSGKTMLSTRFIVEGVNAGEPGVILVFEKRPQEYLWATPDGAELASLTREEKIKLIYIRPLDLSVDETLEQARLEILRLGAKRVVVDSLSGFELALAPAFREDFRESLYRMVGALTMLGVTVMMTVEINDTYNELRLSPHGISFLADAIILQRFTELDGRLQKVMSVVKVRTRQHSKELRAYDITEDGLVVGEALTGYRGILSGNAVPLDPPRRPPARPGTKRGG